MDNENKSIEELLEKVQKEAFEKGFIQGKLEGIKETQQKIYNYFNKGDNVNEQTGDETGHDNTERTQSSGTPRTAISSTTLTGSTEPSPITEQYGK